MTRHARTVPLQVLQRVTATELRDSSDQGGGVMAVTPDPVEDFLEVHPLKRTWLAEIIDILLDEPNGTARLEQIARRLPANRDVPSQAATITRTLNTFCSDASDFEGGPERDLFQRVEPATWRLRSYPDRPDILELDDIAFDDDAMQSAWGWFAEKVKEKDAKLWPTLSNRQRLTLAARNFSSVEDIYNFRKQSNKRLAAVIHRHAGRWVAYASRHAGRWAAYASRHAGLWGAYATRHAHHWGAYAALGMVTLALLLAEWWYASPQEPNLPSQQRPNGPQANYQPGGAGCYPWKINALPAAKAVTEEDRCAQAYEEHRIKQDNLTQQVRLADVAEGNLGLSIRQVRSGFVQTLATIGAFVAAGFAGWAAYRAYRAAEATRKHAQESSEIELRAYVHAANFDITFPPTGSGGTVILQVGWINTGSTPAINCVAESNLQFFVGEPPDDFGFPDAENADYDAPFTLGSNRKIYSKQLQLHLLDITETVVGGFQLYVWGWMDYDDIFKRTPRRRTEFCVAGVGGRNKDGAPGIIFSGYRRHAGMDAGCMRAPRPWPPQKQSGAQRGDLEQVKILRA